VQLRLRIFFPECDQTAPGNAFFAERTGIDQAVIVSLETGVRRQILKKLRILESGAEKTVRIERVVHF
jgi:hypothetical protein